MVRVLARGLRVHDPGAELTVLALGPAGGLAGEQLDVARPADLGLEEPATPDRWADAVAMLKPALLQALLDRGPGPLVYLDATVDVHASLESMVARELASNHMVLSARCAAELPDDGLDPGPEDLRDAGRLGSALVAVGPAPETAAILDWWAERVARAGLPPASAALGHRHAARALTVWADLAPGRFAGVGTLRDPGSAVSRWNLHEHHLGRGPGGEVTVDGRPLRFTHFEGFDPLRPYLLGPRPGRARPATSEPLAELAGSYARRLIDAGWEDARRRADVGRRLPDGTVFDDRMSHLLADAAGEGRSWDVFEPDQLEEFLDWLAGPAPHGSHAGVNRFLWRLYRERDDLQRVYPDLDGADGEGLVGWAWAFGRSELRIPARLLPPRPAWIRERPAHSRPPLVLPRGPRPGLSVNVTGLFRGTLGLGEAARGYVQALEAAHVPVSTSTVDLSQFVKEFRGPQTGYGTVDFAELSAAGAAGFNLICINADELPAFADSVGEEFFTARPSIGVWAWETDHVPERWAPSFELLDEIWVYSRYVAENLARAAPVPVRCVPPPVSSPDHGGVELDLGVPDGFQFLFMFDFFSTTCRKNPVGLVQAFRQAFEPGEGPQLVVKTINGVHRPEALEEVLWAARGRPDVHVVDRSLSARERDALVAGCDCYVSLHRSEGFGLTIAECMALGKPVIATAFSGPTDFMTEENGYLVPYEIVRVGADCQIYPPEGTWADPDLAVAARLMREVVEDPAEASAKGQRARADIARLYAPEVTGAIARARLEELAALWNGGR
jgi:glycosyltransferase involved in cell wall biosynthesis